MLPILFDFDKPVSRNTDETITLLARMARFVIADISDAKSVLQELRAIIPDLPSVPVQPVIIASQEEPGMFDFYRGFRSFLPVHRYDTPEQLFSEFNNRVIEPAEAKALELRGGVWIAAPQMVRSHSFAVAWSIPHNRKLMNGKQDTNRHLVPDRGSG